MLLSVVIHDLDLGRVAVGPPEDHPPLVVDPDRIEASGPGHRRAVDTVARQEVTGMAGVVGGLGDRLAPRVQMWPAGGPECAREGISLPFNVCWHHLRGKNAKDRFDPVASGGEIDLSNDQPSVRTIRQESTGSIEAVFVELDKGSQLWPAVSIAGDCSRCQVFEGKHGATLVRTLARYRPHWRDDDKAVAVMGEKIGRQITCPCPALRHPSARAPFPRRTIPPAASRRRAAGISRGQP